MKIRLAMLAAVSVSASLWSVASVAQQSPEAMVSIYHAAPGHQVALLKWFADQDRVAAAAGTPPAQLYVHQDGADWDYILIQPATTKAQDDAFDAAGKRLGVDVSPHAAIEFRKHIASHSDTYARGPTTAAAYLAWVGEK